MFVGVVDRRMHAKRLGMHPSKIKREKIIATITFCRAVVERARQPVDGEGVGDVGSSAGLERLADHRLRVRRPPLAEDDGDLLVGRRERVRDAGLGQDDDGAVDGGAQPGDVRVPPQRAALPRDGELVHVALPALDRALRDVRRPVRPPAPQLPDAVPARTRTRARRR